MLIRSFFAFALLSASVASAAEPFPLTVDGIMRGPKLVGNAPGGLRFSGDAKDVWFEWQARDEDESATWIVPRSGGTPRRLTEAERRLAPKPYGSWDAAHRRLAGEDRGDVVVWDTVARTRRQLTQTKAGESNARWARTGTHVTFTTGDGVWIVPVDGGGDLLVQLLQAGPAEQDPKLTDSQKYVKEREAELTGWVAEQAKKREREKERSRRYAPAKLDLEDKQSIADAVLASDRYLFVLVLERPSGEKAVDMPRYVTESGYTEVQSVRTNVGDKQERYRLVAYDLQERKASWAEASFAGLLKDAKAETGTTPKARQDAYRDVVWTTPVVTPDGATGIVQVSSADNKDRWLVAIDAATGTTRVLFHEHDEAWVRDLGTGPYGESNLGLLRDGRTVFFTSEKDGWMHLYTVPVAGGEARQLTSGRFEIDEVQLAPSGRRLLITSNEGDPGQRHLWSLPVEGGARTRLTSMTGAQEGVLAPDEKSVAILQSSSSRPPELYVGDPAAPRQVTTSPTPEWLAGPWVEAKIVSFQARDGASVPARLYTPEMLGKTRDPHHPAVVFIHGAGYLQNAHRYWSYYYREYMFHHLLADRGYVVLDVDYRGSAGYGRDWRTAIYRHMGGKDLDDAVDAAKWLAETQGVDAQRLGIYGGSYGGFITLMALFTSPDTFAAGAALRPVTDWAHYNHPYTSNILNTPQADAEAYARSSPIHFAEGLKRPLLILHGMVDDNVHFQDSVRLAQRLIELRKEDWELAVYPVEAHSFLQETSWADEYKRILKLFETHLKR